jgi:hypothetical protein
MGMTEADLTPEQSFHLWAFSGFVSFALTDFMDEYREDTGDKFKPATSGIDQMIDQATGADRAFVGRFVDWCADRYGRQFLPPDFKTYVLKAEEAA